MGRDNMKILIVDDKSENIYLLESLFKGIGYDTISANNGAEALKLLLKQKPDLIISDILMPVMDGFTFCRECKKNQSFKKIPFVFYTATYTSLKDEEFALSLGADKFVLKPQEPDVFITIIEEVMKDVKEKKFASNVVPDLPEETVLKEYNSTLIRKLEDKMTQAEEREKELRVLNAKLQQEIEEHKRAENALRESEERNRLLKENSMDALLLTSPDGSIYSANKTACIMFQMTEEEICKAGRDGVVDLSDPRLYELLEERKRFGKAKGELTFIRKDRSKFPAEISSALFTDSNGHLRSSMVIRDVTDRKKAEEVLKQNEQQLTSIYNTVADAIYYVAVEPNQQYRFLSVNPAFSKITGVPAEQIVGKLLNDIIPQPSLALVLDKYQEAIKEHSLVRWEETSNYPNGELTGVVSVTPVFDKDGNCTHLVGSVHDITERKRLEDTLKISEEKFRITFEKASIGKCLVNLDGYIILANDAMSAMLGYSKEELATKRFVNFTHPKDIEPSLEWMGKMISGQMQKHRFEKKYIHKNGNEVFADVNIALIRDSKNNPLFFVTHMVNITERKIAEEKIALLAHAMRSVSECISITDDKDKIVFVNQAFLDTYGYTENELIGKHIGIVRPTDAEVIEHFKDILPETISGGWKGEVINERKDGTKFPVYLSTSVIKNDDNKPIALIGVATDITENKKILAELIDAKNRAEEMSRLKSNFMANMSHELRTPLVGLLGISEFMVEESEGEYKENAEIIYLCGRRLLGTITEILDFAKLESEKTVVQHSVFNLSQLLLDEIKLYQTLAKKKNIKLIDLFSAEDIPIFSDEKLLREVIDNIINNAIKFTHAGTVTISVERRETEIAIKIIDTGIGIPLAKMEYIFEEFRQVSEGMSRNFEGAGLGLTIVKKYLQLINGNVEVESVLGSGSTFTVRLPCSNGDLQNQLITKPEIQETTSKKLFSDNHFKVLLVEDDLFNNDTIKNMIKKQYDVHPVFNGPAAIDAATQHHYDIILMDINLKHNMSGLDATKTIRKLEGYENIPIVAMTAYAMQNDREEFLEAGCSHYIAKPFSRNDILKLLENITKSGKQK